MLPAVLKSTQEDAGGEKMHKYFSKTHYQG